MTAATQSVQVCSVGLVLCLAYAISSWRKRQLRNGLPLPPGPAGLPLIGSVLKLDTAHPWLSYEQWGKQYGGLVYVNLLGQDFIIINSAEVAHDLFDLRSTIYSERPYIPANELFGLDFNSGLLRYGNEWRHHRKLFNTALNKNAVHQYKSVAIRKAHRFVESLLDAPEEFWKHSKTYAAATIMAAAYGYDVTPKEDPFVTKIEHCLDLFVSAMTPERAALLLAFPFLAHIPSWLPGGKFKQRAAECHALAQEVLREPVAYVVENMAAGTAGESFVRRLIERDGGKLDDEAIKAVAASAFLGGAETSDATLRVFLLAMVLHPEVQTKAQEEIDRVVGTDRLPNFDDREKLPFVEAVVLETFRWRPVTPTGLPHMTAKSDVYKGMYIPKGAIVLANIWAMGHDETQFTDSLDFKPERHLTPSGTLLERTQADNHSFGFGRRICPGRHIADQNVWAAIATILATMRISRARDQFGNEVDVKVEFTSGLSSSPKPFACNITPRSSRARELIRASKNIE